MPRKFRLATESRQGYKRLLGWRRAWICFGALALLSLASLIWLAYRTSQVLNQLVAQLQAASKVAFGLQLLDPFSRGSRGALRVKPISSADVFSDVVEADGRLYLAGPSGVSVYGPDGSKIADYYPESNYRRLRSRVLPDCFPSSRRGPPAPAQNSAHDKKSPSRTAA